MPLDHTYEFSHCDFRHPEKNVPYRRILISVLILKNDDRPDKNVQSGKKNVRSHLDAHQITHSGHDIRHSMQ